MVEYKDFNWNGLKLYLGKKDTGFSIHPIKDDDTYWVKWPDGTFSADYYNLTRAKDHCVSLAQSQINNDLRSTNNNADTASPTGRT